MKQHFRKSIKQDFVFLLYLLWCIICIIRTSCVTTESILPYKLGLIICLYILTRTITDKRWIPGIISGAGVIQAIYTILQAEGLIESNSPLFEITGFMGNPGQLGGFQSVALISGLSLLTQAKNRSFRYVIIASSLLVFYSLVLSDSRAGILATISGIVIIIYSSRPKEPKRHKTFLLILICLIVILPIFLYISRPESANARLLIWRICADMAADKPLFGFGAYGFNQKYMLYQKDYFALHQNPKLYHIADNVSYPYNEFLHIIIEQGSIGLALFLLLVITSVKITDEPSKTASLVTLLIFSSFSYPTYNLILSALFPVLFGNMPPCITTTASSRKVPIIIISLLVAIVSFSCTSIKEKRFIDLVSKTYDNMTYCDSIKINKMFMANSNNLKINASYANLVKHYPEILNYDTIPLIFPSSENWCTIGKYFLSNGYFIEAEKYFIQASDMTPGLMLPKYLLWRTLVSQRKIPEAQNLAITISQMSVKVENTSTLRMRSEVLHHTY